MHTQGHRAALPAMASHWDRYGAPVRGTGVQALRLAQLRRLSSALFQMH